MSLDKIQSSIEKIASATLIGAGVGAFRKKDKDESRNHSILRSAGTGLAVDSGVIGGSALGLTPALAVGVKHIKEHGDINLIPAKKLKRFNRLGWAGILAGGSLGGLGTYHLAKRKKKDK